MYSTSFSLISLSILPSFFVVPTRLDVRLNLQHAFIFFFMYLFLLFILFFIYIFSSIPFLNFIFFSKKILNLEISVSISLSFSHFHYFFRVSFSIYVFCILSLSFDHLFNCSSVHLTFYNFTQENLPLSVHFFFLLFSLLTKVCNKNF